MIRLLAVCACFKVVACSRQGIECIGANEGVGVGHLAVDI
jgi:hypothetical protein